MNQEEILIYKKAGEIAKKVIKYAKSIIDSGIPLIEIAEKIESKILELGGKPAFPCNLSINDIAAHYTPSEEDETLASGLLKVDFGVHLQGYIIDTAFSLDLEDDKENKELIEAAESALNSALKIIKPGIELWRIGEEIQNKITSFKFSPIRNLCGHQLGRYKVHAGITIPNTNNNNHTKLPPGFYAVEPFATTGYGIVYDSKPSTIYRLENLKPIRNPLARKLLAFIEENYKTLPFCERWLVKEFPHPKIALKLLEQAGIISQYSQLVEKSRKKVSQAETTILVNENKTETFT